jgi:ATP-dependent Lhr-like helicase
VLSATDPAQPYGAAMAWPPNAGRPTRVPTALVILVNGEPLIWVDRSSHSLITFAAAVSDGRWCDRLVAVVKDGEARSLELRKIDGDPARESSWYERLRSVGFAEGYRGLVLRS